MPPSPGAERRSLSENAFPAKARLTSRAISRIENCGPVRRIVRRRPSGKLVRNGAGRRVTKVAAAHQGMPGDEETMLRQRYSGQLFTAQVLLSAGTRADSHAETRFHQSNDVLNRACPQHSAWLHSSWPEQPLVFPP